MTSGESIFPHLLAGMSDQPPFVERVFGEPLFHSEGEVIDLAFAADGTVASIEESGVLRRWTAEGHPRERFFLSDLEMVWRFATDAEELASGGADLALWDVPTGSELRRVTQPSWVTAVAFSTDGKLLASGHDDGTIRLWDTRSLKERLHLSAHPAAVSTLAFSPDGSRLASAGEDRAIRIWEVNTGKAAATLMGHPDRIPSLAWHPSGNWLVSAGWDTTARIWQPPAPEPLMLLNSHAEQVFALAFSPDGKLLACADSDNSIHIWEDPQAGKVRHVMPGHHTQITCLTFSQDGTKLASAGNDGLIHVWDPIRGVALAGADSPHPNRIALLPGQPLRLAAPVGSSARLWNAHSGEQLPSPSTPEHVIALAASPDGQLLATSGHGLNMHLWDTASGSLLQTCAHTKGPIPILAFAPDSQRVASASASDGLVWIWKRGAEEAILVIPEAADSCTLEALAFHPDGKRLAVGGVDWLQTGGSDGAVCLWDIEARDRIAAFSGGVVDLAFDPKGTLLAGATLRKSVVVWEIDKQDTILELDNHDEGVTAIAISPDGEWLVAAGEEGTLRVWKLASGEPIIAREVDAMIQSLVFSADGRWLFSGNANTTCFRLDMKRLLEE